MEGKEAKEKTLLLFSILENDQSVLGKGLQQYKAFWGGIELVC